MSDQQETGLPPNWEVRQSKSKNLPYYFNTKTTQSHWEPPEGTNTEKLKVYMAKHHLSNLPAVSGAPGQIRVRHLLVKHKGSRRPTSWRENTITRTKDEAQMIIENHRKRILAGESSLKELAATESDCSSAGKGGDLGYFGKGDMQPEFEEAAFALKEGQLSEIVETASGLHLIQRVKEE